MNIYKILIIVKLCMLLVTCKTFQYDGLSFDSEREMNDYIQREKTKKEEEIKKNEVEAQLKKAKDEEELAFSYFSEHFKKDTLLDLRDEVNRIALSEAYFNQYENPSANKIYFENQFDYNRKKDILSKIKKKKYLFFEGVNMTISEYNFKGSFFNIEWVGVKLPYPQYILKFRMLNLIRTDVINHTYGIGGYYEIINEAKLKINTELAEGFLDRFKNGKMRYFAVLELLKAKDKPSGIKCSDLQNSLFDGSGNEVDINFYVRPTCISEEWGKLKVRDIEKKLVGFYIIDGETVYKSIIK